MPRKTFDRRKLDSAVLKLQADDDAAPPAGICSLFDVTRSFLSHIENRASLGWDNQLLANLITDAGYPISAATLRSYRKRLKDEAMQTAQGASNSPPKAVENQITSGGSHVKRPAKDSSESLPAIQPNMEIGQEKRNETYLAVPIPAEAPTALHKSHSEADNEPTLQSIAAVTQRPQSRTFSILPGNIPRI